MLSDEDLLEYLDGAGLSKYDMPEFLLHLEAVPLTASGKVLKRNLVESVAAGTLVPRAVRFRSHPGTAG